MFFIIYSHHIETRQLTCRANSLTGFYMMGNIGRYWVKNNQWRSFASNFAGLKEAHAMVQSGTLTPCQTSTTELFEKAIFTTESSFIAVWQGSKYPVALILKKFLPDGTYVFKVNNRNTKTAIKITASLTLFWCLCCYLWTYFTSCSSVSIVNFEQANAGWAISASLWIVVLPCGNIKRIQNKYHTEI